MKRIPKRKAEDVRGGGDWSFGGDMGYVKAKRREEEGKGEKTTAANGYYQR